MNAPVAVLRAEFRIALDPATRRVDDGATLIGGFPLRIVRLSPAGQRLVDRWAGGAPVDATGGAQRLARRLLHAGLAHPRPTDVPPPWTPADVAAVIPVHGDPGDLDRTLSTLGPVGEVLVVDDASRDGTAIAAVADAHSARLLRLDRNLGPAAAREVGWQASTRPVVAFVDADVEPTDGWLDPLLADFADPQVGAVAPRVAPAARPGTPAALAAYEARRSSARQRYRYGTSAAALGQRDGDAVAPLTVSGWSATAWGLVVAGSPAAGVAVGAGTTAALVPKLRSLRHPIAEALRLAGLGNLLAGRQVADALRGPWWPLTLVLFRRWRRARPALLVAAVVPALIEHREEHPDLGVAPFAALRLADDLTYGTGVWAGCIARRDLTALVPAFAGRFPPPDDNNTGEDHEGRQGNPPRLPVLVPRPGEGRQPVR